MTDDDSVLLQSEPKMLFVSSTEQIGLQGGRHVDAVTTQTLCDDRVDLLVEMESNPLSQEPSAQSCQLLLERRGARCFRSLRLRKGEFLGDLLVDFSPMVVVVGHRSVHRGQLESVFPGDLFQAATQPKVEQRHVRDGDPRATEARLSTSKPVLDFDVTIKR